MADPSSASAIEAAAGRPRRMGFPLSAKILLFFFLNLAFLAVAGILFVRIQLGLGIDSLLAGRANQRLQAMAQVVVAELNDRPRDEWTAILKRSAAAYHVQLGLFRNDDGARLAGEIAKVPPEVLAKIEEGPRLPEETGNPNAPGGNFPPPWPGPMPSGPGPAAAEPAGTPAIFPKSILHAGEPPLYWILIRARVTDRANPRPERTTLLLASETLGGSGLLFDFTPWAVGGSIVLAISVLLWFPLVRSITRALGQMTGAAEEIARGRFETRVRMERSDELGRLASALNLMAARLREFFTGQRRFLGDIAHELCSPLARMELALGILDQRAGERERPYVADVREEARQMSALVNELLSFSKASLGGKNIELSSVAIPELVRGVLSREAGENANISVNTPALSVFAEPGLLARALGNVVRNSIRYASDAGPVSVSARGSGEHVILSVTDQGPGVPEQALDRLFDPFFRPDNARARETGGTGLGLAIVKSCVEACGGAVFARNCSPHGLQVDIRLRRA